MPSVQARLFSRLLAWQFNRIPLQTNVRQAREIMQHLSFPLPTGTTITPSSQPAGEWIQSAGVAEDSVLLYLHGGGYTLASPGIHRALAARIARVAGVSALMLDYHLAPEYPYPTALEDALYAYCWLLDRGYTANRIVLSGDSAGGGLALALMLRLRAAGMAQPAAAALISPWTDLTLSVGSAVEVLHPSLKRESLLQMAPLYYGEADPRDPFISPVYADLRGLPPLLLHAGDHEILRDDSIRLAERARLDGVNVTLRVMPGMWHVWHIYPGELLPESQQSVTEMGQFLRGYLTCATVKR